MKENVLEGLNLKEDHERECKLATGGLPESIWETYSSFVNVGERAGSGVDKIMTAWEEQNWKKPEFDFSERQIVLV